MLAVVRDDGLVLGPTPAPRGAAARGGPAADGVRDGHRVVLLQRAQLGKEQTLYGNFTTSLAKFREGRAPGYLPRSRLPPAFQVTSRVPGYPPRATGTVRAGRVPVPTRTRTSAARPPTLYRFTP